MKLVKNRDKTFKIIPETKMVHGIAPKKYVMDELDGVDESTKNVIVSALCCCENDIYRYLCSKNETVEANAYCDEKDVFDEKTGILVCSAKLDHRNHLKMSRKIRKAIKILHKSIEFLEIKLAFHEQKAKAIEDDLVRTYGRLPV